MQRLKFGWPPFLKTLVIGGVVIATVLCIVRNLYTLSLIKSRTTAQTTTFHPATEDKNVEVKAVYEALVGDGNLVNKTVKLRVFEAKGDWKSAVQLADGLCNPPQDSDRCLWLRATTYEHVIQTGSDDLEINNKLVQTWHTMHWTCERFWQQAQSMTRSYSLSDAKIWIERAARAHPETARDWYFQGLAKSELGQWVEAIASLNQALMAGFPKRDSLFAIGTAQARMSDFQLALQTYGEAIEAESHENVGRSDVWFTQGWLAAYVLKPNNVGLAILAFEHSIYTNDFSQGNTGLANAYFQLGHVYFRVGDFPGAEHSYRRSIEIAPLVSAYRVSLSAVLFQLGKEQEAFSTLTEVLRVDPNQLEGLLAMGEYYKSVGDVENAKSMFVRALIKWPKDKRASDLLKSLQ